MNAEICFAMKCVTSHYSQRSMNERQDLIAAIFPSYKRTRSNVGVAKLEKLIKCVFKKYFLENVWDG